MKTRIVTLLVIGFFTCMSIAAKDPVITTYSNTETTEFGTMKEFTSFNVETQEPEKRTVYNYDFDGNITEKTIYVWGGKNNGWIGAQRLQYTYGDDKTKPLTLTFTVWDSKLNTWSNKSQIVNY